jgi:small subunit ribosomal protein S20
MANHFSALKRTRQTEKRTAANRSNRSRVRSAIRGFREALASGNNDQVKTAYSSVASAIDKSVQKGVLHKNTASRYKARLNARVKALATK